MQQSARSNAQQLCFQTAIWTSIASMLLGVIGAGAYGYGQLNELSELIQLGTAISGFSLLVYVYSTIQFTLSKGYHWAWSIIGLFGILGWFVLSLLPIKRSGVVMSSPKKLANRYQPVPKISAEWDTHR